MIERNTSRGSKFKSVSKRIVRNLRKNSPAADQPGKRQKNTNNREASGTDDPEAFLVGKLVNKYF